jgi:hypothetical protein
MEESDHEDYNEYDTDNKLHKKINENAHCSNETNHGIDIDYLHGTECADETECEDDTDCEDSTEDCEEDEGGAYEKHENISEDTTDCCIEGNRMYGTFRLTSIFSCMRTYLKKWFFLIYFLYYSMKDKYEYYYYLSFKHNVHFFNYHYLPKQHNTLIPFLMAIDFKAHSINKEIILTKKNYRNLRSFGIYLSSGLKEICLEDVILFCELPSNIITLNINFLPFISKNILLTKNTDSKILL